MAGPPAPLVALPQPCPALPPSPPPPQLLDASQRSAALGRLKVLLQQRRAEAAAAATTAPDSALQGQEPACATPQRGSTEGGCRRTSGSVSQEGLSGTHSGSPTWESAEQELELPAESALIHPPAAPARLARTASRPPC